MKKIILSAAALFVFGLASAQDTTTTTTEGGKGFASGDVFMTGAVGFSSTSTADAKSSSFTISPKAGFFVSDNIAVGVALGYTSTATNSGAPGEDDATDNMLSVGAFGRYYATPASDFSFFAQLGFNYNSSTSNTGATGADDYKVNGFDVALSPGVSYFLSSHFAMEANIGALSYTTSKPDVDGAENTNTFGLHLDLTDIMIGLVYKF